MFNAARALLLVRGFQPEQAKTHKTVLRLFSQEFVQDGTFDRDLGGLSASPPTRDTWPTTRAE